MNQWAGELSWSEFSYPVTSGNHTFKWEFDKDQSVSSGSDCAWLDYISLPTGALTSIFASFTSDVTEICENEMVHFQDASLGAVTSWNWVFEGGTPATSTIQNPVVAYTNPGLFDVSLTVSDGANSNTLAFENYILVEVAPVTPDVPEGPTSVGSFPGWTSEYATNDIANANDYDWYLDPVSAGVLTVDGHICTIDWQDYYEGSAYLKVRAVNDCGESDYSGNLQIDITLTDINENETGPIQVFPNPNNGKFTIHLGNSAEKSWEVKIYNSFGKAVYATTAENLSHGNFVVDLGKVDSGIYYIVLSTDETTMQEKIIIK
ncbi:MAG: T9SS type A sorting domain-containing protein [Bacteroidales bacterium]